mgnify:CR=1 FL=1
MFSLMAVQVDMCATSSDNVRIHCHYFHEFPFPIWRPKTGSSYIFASNEDFWKISNFSYMFSPMAVPVHMCATSSYNVRHPKKSNMAAGKPEVVTSTLIVKIFEQFQRVGLCLHARPFQRTRQQYNTTTPDTRKIQYGGEKYGRNQFLASVLDFLVSDVVGRCSAHVHWNGHVRKKYT